MHPTFDPEAEPGPALAALLARATAEERRRLLALRADWLARLVPVDAAETQVVETIVAVLWRAERLVALEAEVTDRLLAGRPLGELPGLAILARLKARLDKERALAERDLAELYRLRPPHQPLPARHPARRHWLAARLREGTVLARTPPTAAARTAEPPATPAPAAARHAAPEPGAARA